MIHYDLFTSFKDDNGHHTYKYRLHRILGKGAYASVYLSDCIDMQNEKVVKLLACKVIDPTKVSEEYIKKFLPRELEILRKVDHPHIVHLHAIYRSGPLYFIFMRYAENSDLLDFIIKTGDVHEDQARLWTKQLSLALQYLHTLHIVHRDIKCENILVTANYNVKLTDMGFSRFLVLRHGEQILSETYCGSAAYAAPEIIKEIPYDPKAADVWSLGIVIFVMINKSFPFHDANLKYLYLQQLSKKWRFKPNVAARVSLQVRELLQKLLEPNPEYRYTIGDVLESDWMHMDPRIMGMTDDERFALLSAKEEVKEIMKKH